MATTSTGASSTADGTVEAPESMSLSMSVKPGQPVPLALVSERSHPYLGGLGYRGQSVDVALIDSGVTPVDGLDQPGKILYGPDLSNEGGLPNLANLDTFGHGTHMAGIIAGDDGDRVIGLAPESRIVSVKVAGATGETNIAQVIAAIDWVIEHKNDNGLNIRVLNLSLGLDGVKTSQGDPLSAAAERAWNAGIVVVAAAGNRGNEHGGIDSPALSPYVLAVGGMESYESYGTQDSMASWSSGGNDIRTPDVVAPGRSILSFRVPGSMLDQTYPSAIVGERYFLGSGTSQSAAVVSGFAAAMLSGNPALTPDQIKFLFMRTARDLVAGRILDGNGKINPAVAGRYIFYVRRAQAQDFPLAIAPQGLGCDQRPVRRLVVGWHLERSLVVGWHMERSLLVRSLVVRSLVVGRRLVGSFLVGSFLVGSFLVRSLLVGSFLVRSLLVRSLLVRSLMVGSGLVMNHTHTRPGSSWS